MSAPFTHLQVHSHYSLMRGTAGLEALCAAAVVRGFDALALTDTDGLYGAVRFFDVAREAGLRPILGAEITTPSGWEATEGVALTGGSAAAVRPTGVSPAGPRATLLVRDGGEYASLCRLLTRRHLDPRFDLAAALAAESGGLVILTASLGLLEVVRCARGPRDLYLALGPSGAAAAGAQRGGVLRAIETARRLGIEPVAVNDVHFVDARDDDLHRLLRAIALNTTRDRVPPEELAPPSAWLKPQAEMERLVPHCPEALATAARIAGECALDAPPWGRLVFPRYADLMPSDGAAGGGATDAFALLKTRCEEGARWRYGSVTPAVRARLEHELAIVRDKGFADYFLVVQEIVRQSPRTCGRGSAAASIISYCLGITHVEPIRHDLYFERFLNRGRVDPPDIDVDFCWDERDDVIDWVFRAVGEERVAMIANHVTFRSRAAVREVAKVFGLPDAEIAKVTGALSFDWSHTTAIEAAVKNPMLRGDDLEAARGGLLGRKPWPEILDLAARLDGTPRHLSVHCGGVVMAPDGVDAHVPVERAAKGVRVIQWEKDQAEEAGLVKIDLLGNRSLSVIRDACAAIHAGGGPEIRYGEFDPVDDPRTQEIVRDGDTMGVFYVESPAMRQLQQKTRRGDFDHLVIHSSIIRPAANEYIREYVRRLRGGAYAPIHPILADVLRDTYGIMCYQEDVARVAIRMAGFTDAEADGLRKVLSKKWAGKQVEDFRQRFAAGAVARGIAGDVVTEVWRMILSFSGYSFCKPHSASYALVSFKSAWLKAHHPAEFMAAVLANGGGYYSPFAYVSECRRMGIAVLPPDVNASALSWSGRSAAGAPAEPSAGARVEPAAAGRRGTVRAGLGEIRGLREETAKAIVAECARGGPYAALDDLLRRVVIEPADARRLVRAGALDGVGLGARHGARGHAARPLLHWRIQEWEARGEGRGRGGTRPLFAPEPGPLPEPRPHDAAKLLRDEEETLGMLLSRHPLTLYRDALLRLRASGTILVRGSDIARHVGGRVAMIGWLITGKIVTTRDDEPMEFVSFEDTTAIYETTFFPRPYARFCRMLNAARPYLLRGRVEEDFGAVTLTVEEVGFLDRVAAALSRGGAGSAPAAARPGPDRRPSAGRSAAPRASSDPPA
jgi:DNA-directed DNA polymerase III PolC